jgi:hypothetical protein
LWRISIKIIVVQNICRFRRSKQKGVNVASAARFLANKAAEPIGKPAADSPSQSTASKSESLPKGPDFSGERRALPARKKPKKDSLLKLSRAPDGCGAHSEFH